MPTSNMGLTKHTVGTTSYPAESDSNFDIIDLHDHSSSKGVQITAGGIASNAVTTAKILDQNVTQAKLAARATGTTVAAGGVAISNSSGTFTKTTTPEEDITNLSVTITTTGRPVVIFCIGASAANSFFSLNPTAPNGAMTALLFIDRGGSDIVNMSISIEQSSTGVTFKYAPSTVYHIDPVAAGTYTYKVRVALASVVAGTTFNAEAIKLVAYEI